MGIKKAKEVINCVVWSNCFRDFCLFENALIQVLTAFAEPDKKPELAIEMGEERDWKFGDLIIFKTGEVGIFFNYGKTKSDLRVLSENVSESGHFTTQWWDIDNCEKIGSGYQYVSLEGILKRLKEGR